MNILETLIKSGGGNRPNETQQPLSVSLISVPNPTDLRRSGR